MYKLYQSKKWIFWDQPNQIDYPDFITNDQYFDWEFVDSNNISFETYKTGKITVKDNSISYFKLEKPNQITKYFFVKNVDKVLTNGFVYNVEIDVYMTYTRLILNELTKKANENILLNSTRCSLATGMLNDSQLKGVLINSSKLNDPLIESIEKIFDDQQIKNIKHTGTINVSLPNGRITKLDLRYGFDIKKREFLGSVGYCAVFTNKVNGCYDVFPITDPLKTGKNSGERPQMFSQWIVGSADDRNVDGYYNSLQNLLDILPRSSNHGSSSFVGVFKYPYRHGSYLAEKVSDTNESWHFLKWELKPLVPDIWGYPINILVNENDSLIELWGELHDEIQYSKARNKKLHYFKHIVKKGANNFAIEPKFYLSFANEFLFVPALNPYSDANDIEGFGSQLPSPDDQYYKFIYEAKKSYDMGLTSLTNNYANLASNAILSTALAGGAGGLSSVITGVISTELQRNQLTKGYQYQVAGASQSWVNSNTIDIWYYIQFYRAVKQDPEMWQPTNINDGMRQLWFEFPLNELSKKLIKQTYHLYGFPTNALISLFKMLDRSYFNNRFYIELDQAWTTNNIKRLAKLVPNLENENSEILMIIANQMINGLRIWLNNSPNYESWVD